MQSVNMNLGPTLRIVAKCFEIAILLVHDLIKLLSLHPTPTLPTPIQHPVHDRKTTNINVKKLTSLKLSVRTTW